MKLVKVIEGKEVTDQEFEKEFKGILMGSGNLGTPRFNEQYNWFVWDTGYETKRNFNIEYLGDRCIRITFEDGTSVRGKWTRIAPKIRIKDEEVKQLVNRLKTIELGYEIWVTKDFIFHYEEMKQRGICSSCMSYKANEYSLAKVDGEHVHPLTPYEQSDDFWLGLIKPLGVESEYPWLARMVMMENEDTEECPEGFSGSGVAYGEEAANRVLRTVFPQDLGGGRIPLIEADCGAHIAPYNDDCGGWEIDCDYLFSSYCGEQTNPDTGVIGGQLCEDCGEMHNDEDLYYVDNHGMVCEHCISDYTYIDSYGEYTHMDNAFWCESCDEWHFDCDSVECDETGIYVCENCVVQIESVDGTIYSFMNEEARDDFISENIELFTEDEEEE
jgi:hypothetical protein